MKLVHLNLFSREVTCTYRGETYLVRDNGAVLTRRRDHARLRPLDEKWTFGRVNKKRGYMQVASIPVHRVVATAFLGPQPSKDHVVDHIDTNRRNNRPENLRWVTKLENILLNPITARRVEIAYGFIEHFSDLDSIVGKHVELLKKQGILLLGVPNYRGISHAVLKRLAPRKWT